MHVTDIGRWRGGRRVGRERRFSSLGRPCFFRWPRIRQTRQHADSTGGRLRSPSLHGLDTPDRIDRTRFDSSTRGHDRILVVGNDLADLGGGQRGWQLMSKTTNGRCSLNANPLRSAKIDGSILGNLQEQRVTFENQARHLRRKAFSLVELIVVMVILGMLAGLVAVRTRGYLINSKQNAAKAQISNLVKAVDSFYTDQGRYPTTDEGLQILVTGTESWPDGWINRVPLDPWKKDYEYFSPGSNGPFEIVSLGADGREGGEGEDRDFTSDDLSG